MEADLPAHVEFPDNLANAPNMEPANQRLVFRNYQRTRKQIMSEASGSEDEDKADEDQGQQHL